MVRSGHMRYVPIALLLIAATASAATWQQITTLDSDGSLLLVDAANIGEVKGFRKAWFKSVYTSDQPVPTEYQQALASGRSYRRVETMRFFSCPERTSALAELRWYGADDQALGNFRHDPLKFFKVPAGTPEEQMLEAVCKVETANLEMPFELQAKMARPVNPDDYYPSGSVRRGEQGSPVVKVCVGPTGKLLRAPIVVETSGYPGLDEAAIEAASATRYSAGRKDGTALPVSCMKFKIKFGLR